MKIYSATFLVFAAALLAGIPVRADIPATEFEKAMETYLKKDENLEKFSQAFQAYATRRQQDAMKKEQERQEKEMEEQFKNPIKIDVSNAPVRGNPSAKVTIVEFSDFQCPYCKRGAQVMEQLLKDMPNDVKVAFKHLPLPMHPMARPAARAAVAAGKQGKFWEMHDKLFGNQEALSEDAFEKYAKELGLNVDKFKADIKDPATDKQIEEDSKLANSLEINGTPGFVVNGVKVFGLRPPEAFKKIVERWKSQMK